MTLAEVQLWGRTIGAVSLEEGSSYTAFQYDPAFAQSGIEVSPITMPLNDRVYVFPDLPQKTFHGLPGLLADSLPDRFGNALIDTWLAMQGRTSESFNAVDLPLVSQFWTASCLNVSSNLRRDLTDVGVIGLFVHSSPNPPSVNPKQPQAAQRLVAES